MRFLRHYKIVLIIFFLFSCASNAELVINNRITIPADLQYRLIDAEYKKHKKNSVFKNYIVVSSKRIFVHPEITGPESAIMRAGIEEALKGKYLEAETLFNEIKENINDGSVENNLGIIYEITKRENEALAMYITALMKSPGNTEIKNNLLAYINDKR